MEESCQSLCQTPELWHYFLHHPVRLTCMNLHGSRRLSADHLPMTGIPNENQDHLRYIKQFRLISIDLTIAATGVGNRFDKIVQHSASRNVVPVMVLDRSSDQLQSRRLSVQDISQMMFTRDRKFFIAEETFLCT